MTQVAAKLTIPVNNNPEKPHQEYELELSEDSYGNLFIDADSINQLGNTRILFKDTKGMRNTAADESKISYIKPSGNNDNGVPQGILLYRGFDVKQLATHSTFLESSYLILNGEPPSKEEFKQFSDELKANRIIDKQTEEVINQFDRQTHATTIMSAALASLAARYEDKYNMASDEDRQELAIRMIAKMPTITAHILKHQQDQRTVSPDEELGHAANFLHMLFSTQAKKVVSDPKHIKVLDMILTLHAEHSFAASTFVARTVASCGTSTISCIIAALTALSGPLHGGANEEVVRMLEGITSDEIPDIINRAKDPSDPFKLFGFGHRIYNAMDPRAVVLRELTMNIIKESHEEKPSDILKTAILLEEAALKDEYFINRKLFPNVDFYSGLAMMTLGIPTNLFPLIFATARTSGWLAHIEECRKSGASIYRPNQYYTGWKFRPIGWP